MLDRPGPVHVEQRSSSASKGRELIRDTPLFCSEVPGREAGLPADPMRNGLLVRGAGASLCSAPSELLA